MTGLLITTAALAILGAPVDAASNDITQVTLRIDGVHSDEDGVAIMHALAQVPNIKVATRPTMKNPFTILVPLQGANYDVGDLARVVAAVKTPNRTKGAPSASLLLSYKPREAGAETEKALEQSLEQACANLKGVDAKKSKLDANRKEIHLKLDDKGAARLADIQTAFPGLALDFEVYPRRDEPQPSERPQQAKNDVLEAWKYPDVKGWGATTRKHMHSANGFTEDSLDKVLAFYKEKMEFAKQRTRDLQAMDSSSGSSSYTHAEGEPPSVLGWVLFGTVERSVWVQIWRGAGDKVTHIALVVDQR